MRNKTGKHILWENGVHYPGVFLGAHLLTKTPEDSGYEIGFYSEHYTIIADISPVIQQLFAEGEVIIGEYSPKRSRGKYSRIIT